MMEESPPPPPPPPLSSETMTTVSPGHFRNTVALSPTKDDKHHHNHHSPTSHHHHNHHQNQHHHHHQHQRQQHHHHHQQHHQHLLLPSSSPMSSVGQSPSTTTTISSSAGVSHPNRQSHPVVPPPTLLTQKNVSSSSAATEMRRNINNDRNKVRSRSPIRNNANAPPATATTPERVFRSRYNHHKLSSNNFSKSKSHKHHGRNHRKRTRSSNDKNESNINKPPSIFQKYCYNHTIVRSTLSCMNLIGKLLVWLATIASVSGVVWYSYELKNNGTDPHLIAWFSAGAFVLLGFPISIYGIVMHLLNYNQPHVQCYVVRILWMVPIYSIGSWISLRYKNYAIYIETLRDCYESFVLYSFLQFLIEVLGGEDALILMLKDKSPTRGVHMWGLQYCGLKPWLMGQPVRRTYDHIPEGGDGNNNSNNNLQPIASPTVATIHPSGAADNINHFDSNANTENNSNKSNGFMTNSKRYKRVHWTSPFFIYCKFGVLQYVLLKLICTFLVLILEKNHIYKEGDFTYKGGYLYICTITNLSQCWALYCLIFFYYATKNELGPINPVGKFLAVKALVFFTWWQSLGIAILYQYNLIPYYNSGSSKFFGFGTIVDDDYTTTSSSTASSSSLPLPLSEDAALALDELGGSSLGDLVAASTTAAATTSSSLSSSNTEWTSEDVAKGLQDYLICIEMFVAALVHVFVFSHTEFDSQAVEARESALHQQPHLGGHYNKRLGRKWKDWDNKSAYSGTTLSTGNNYNNNNHNNGSNHTPSGRGGGGAMGSSSMEMVPLPPLTADSSNDESCDLSIHDDDDDDDLIHPLDRMEQQTKNQNNNGDDDVEQPLMERLSTVKDSEDGDNDGSFYSMSSEELNDDDWEDDGDDEDDEFDEDDEYNNERRGLLSSSQSRKNEKGTSSSKNVGGNNNKTTTTTKRPGFVKALLDSAIPQDLRDNTVGIIKGEYVVERKTLLHHAATSDSYDLFSRVSRPNIIRKKNNVTTTSDAANSNANAAVAATANNSNPTTTTAAGLASMTSASLGGNNNEKQRHEPTSNPRPLI